ncbi:MAG: Cell division protein ZipA [Pseudomonadota bacterium]|nr:Cell division protein ZipA [Pseudomonadota bacterium]
MEMLDKTQMQWLLAIIGAIAIALIYLWGMRARIREGIRKRRRRPTGGNEPALGGASEQMSADLLKETHDFGELGRITPDHHLAKQALVDVEIRPILRNEHPPVAEINPPPAPLSDEPPHEPRQELPFPDSSSILEPPQMTVALTVIAPRGLSFTGPSIQSAAHELGFQLGTHGLFDYGLEKGHEPLFSMAHLRAPGSFDARTLEALATPGLLLFMNLPGPLEEMQALEQLVVEADQLAQKLGGMIGDEHRNRLTNQSLLQLRNEITEFQEQLRIWASSSG